MHIRRIALMTLALAVVIDGAYVLFCSLGGLWGAVGFGNHLFALGFGVFGSAVIATLWSSQIS